MDNRDLGKNQTSGNDSHGVHVCYKCGWPFPNPHPSARHRRAHKKNCGTIEGYTLVDSQGTAYSVLLSDNEHPSDEDRLETPSQLVVQRSFDEKKSAGSGEKTNRSEDEAFLDAVTEFSDSGSGPSGKGIEDSSDVVKKQARSVGATLEDDAKTVLSFEDDAITASVPPSSNLADSSHDTEIQGNNVSADALESESQPSHVTTGSVGITDCRTEKSGHESINKKQSSTCDSSPSQLESQADVSQENMKKRAREESAVTDVMGNNDKHTKRNVVDDLIVVDKKENEKAHLDGLLLDFDTTSHNAIQTSEAVSMSGKTEDATSDHVAVAGVIELKEQCGDDLDSKRSLKVPSPEVDVFEQANNYFSSNQINVSATGEMAPASSGKLTEIANEQGEVNDNFHVLSVPDHIPVLKNPEIMIEGYKDHKSGRMLQFVDVDSFEVINNEDSAHKVTPSNSFPSLSDEGEQLFASGSHISVDNIQQGGNSELVKDSVHNVSPTNSFSTVSDEGEQLFASDTHFSIDETELGGPQLKETVNKDQLTDESCVLKDAAGNEVEKCSTVQCPQEQLPDDSRHNLCESISSEHCKGSIPDTTPVAVLVDVEVRQASNLVGTDDAAENEISRFDTTRSEEVKGVAEDSSGKIMVTPENLGILSEGKVESISFEHGTGSISDTTSVDVLVDSEVRQASNLVGADDAADYEISGFDTTRSEEVKGVAKDSSRKIMMTPENLGILSEGKVETISSEHGTGSMSDTIPVDVLVNAEVRKASNLVGTDDAADHEISGFDTTESAEAKGIAEDSSEKITATPENLGILSEGEVHEGNDFCEGQNTSDNGIVKGENSYGSKIESREGDSSLGLVDGSSLMNTTMTPEIAKDLHETLVISKNVDNASEINVSEPEYLLLNKASDNQDSALEGETNDKAKVLVEDCADSESDNVRDNDELHKSINTAGDVEILQMPSNKIDDFEVLQKSPKEHVTKESQLSPSNASSSIQNRATVGDNPARDFAEPAHESQSASCADEGENKIIAQQLGASAADLSVDSGSQTDSLEGHWGSVSVLSTQSDIQATVDTEPSGYGSKASAEAEKADVKKPETSTDGEQESEKSDIFEPPSFMTLVEPRDGDKVAADDDGIQTAQNLQQPIDSQAGWFPSLTNVVNESQGRKKNEEIIAKVTNWSTPKQHAPLKNLLGEANMENKSKLLNPKDNQPPPVVQKDEPKPTVISARDNSVADAISKPTASPQKSLPETIKKDDTGKEWNSPARYPADIKREKRKVKGRPYWAQFMCCSSVN